MITDFYFIKKRKLQNKDIYSLERAGEYYYSGGWHVKGVYSLFLGFIFSASTIWNPNFMFFQSYSWIVGGIVAAFSYYLLAKKHGVKFIAYRCEINNKEIKIEKKIKIIDE